MSETAKKKAVAPAKKAASVKKKPASAASAKKKPASAASSPKKPGSAASSKKRPVRPAKKAVQTGSRPVKKAAASTRGKGDASPEKRATPKKRSGGGRRPPKKRGEGLFAAINAGLIIGIGVMLALGVRLQGRYGEFNRMREVVDRQTFYEGTTVEGVDVSSMTLSNAMDYWRERVEPRYAGRTVTLENGATVTAGELGYASDYEAVLYAAWSAGRSGSLEQRYRAVATRGQNPMAYGITRRDYSDQAVERYVQAVAERVDEPAVDAAIESFDAQSYAFVFSPSREGRSLDTEALKRDIESAIAQGGGSARLLVSAVQPRVTTDEVSSQYGLIDYAITNANSSSRPRLNNIRLAMSLINGTRVGPGETFSFNDTVGERTVSRGFKKATAYSGGDVTEDVGGGICQVSTTLFNAAVKADMEIVERHSHSLTVAYVDKGKDATVDWGHQDFKFRNNSGDDVYICCYLTDDRRVRFGIFGRLLPNGESITLEAVTTEVTKYDTEYQASSLLAHGETAVLQPGRNGYKAEAYKVRWDAQGNQISRELLCKSFYQKKNEIIQYGA